MASSPDAPCMLCVHAPLLQDWTKIENEDAQGVVEITYRTGTEPGKPPDVQVIQKQMAIVAWQPGPNRILQVPTEVGWHSAQRPCGVPCAACGAAQAG